MARASKFTDEQRLEIALDMLSGKLSVLEVCRKWDIGSTYAYKLKDRAIELLRTGIGKPAGRTSGQGILNLLVFLGLQLSGFRKQLGFACATYDTKT